jgi:hypothetical protein
MKEPLRTRYVPGYDLFKLTVAVILAIILIILLLRDRDARFASLGITPAATTESIPVLTPTTAITPLPGTEIAPPPTTAPEPTEPTPAPVVKPTPEPSPTAAPSGGESAEPQPASDPNECPSKPARIRVGSAVRVVSWLYFRAAPGLGKTILLTNKPGTEMDVIGGPVCTQFGGDPPKAYLWWNLRMKDGREGWSAEAPLNSPGYFLEPLP